MLLDVAVDLDAEAEAIEAEMGQEQDGFGRRHRAGLSEVLLSITGLDGEAR
jgi:hypothetical protein